MEDLKVTLENASIKDYYDLEKILKRNGIEVKIIEQSPQGTEMGVSFSELIILLPLLTPIAVQIRKAIEAYLVFKKPLKQEIVVTLEKNGKKMKIQAVNSQFPDIETFRAFFG